MSDLCAVVGAHGAAGHVGPVVQLPVGQVAPNQAPAKSLAKLPPTCMIRAPEIKNSNMQMQGQSRACLACVL